MSKEQIWETRPLECWAKAKELRAKWQASQGSAEKTVGQGNTDGWHEAFPAVTVVEDNPAGSMIQNKSSPFARKCRLASEIRGWGRELCGYVNNLWGSQFLGYDLDGTFPNRKFVVPMPCQCDQHGKRGQQCRDLEPVPQWMADRITYFGERDEERDVALTEHKVYANLRILNDMERIFGQKLDDEKMIQLMNTSDMIRKYAMDITIFMTYKPSPISVKDLYSFYTIGSLTKVDPEETLALWKSFRDEVEWRAKNQIAAVGTERYRWIEAHPPSWHFLKYYRYMEKYGAVCLGSQYSHIMGGNIERKPDGSLGDRDRGLYPPGTPMVTREDIVRVKQGPDARKQDSFKADEYMQRDRIVKFAEIMQADGAILAIWRAGVGCTLTRKEQAMYLKDAGLNVMHYEGSQPGDRTDLDETRFLDQLDAWMESQGLNKLED
ncbi:MAG: 2-hydroxyacyl-CoA dehydratase [Peptococcaceae bacterium]|jgi:benzoyl-CoA reductase subunit B|nr:2-hydroxyacyl-CoA dehydratase [Peptococcaceae bacterium]